MIEGQLLAYFCQMSGARCRFANCLVSHWESALECCTYLLQMPELGLSFRTDAQYSLQAKIGGKTALELLVELFIVAVGFAALATAAAALVDLSTPDSHTAVPGNALRARFVAAEAANASGKHDLDDI
jgi:hypothetical protein